MSTSTNSPRSGRAVPARPSLFRSILRPRNLAITAIALFALIQVVSFPVISMAGWQTNPNPLAEPAWDKPETRALAVRACYDCHSDETVWPWYSQVAPVSWLVTRHVIDGRRKLNFSEWGVRGVEVNEVTRAVRSGKMPTKDFLLMHPEAKLTDAEKQQLIDGLSASLR
ncbi:MAG: heme-binding domain-containing protein [Chloroflexales bacterium]